MTRHARILVVGHACVDTVTQIDRMPAADEKLEARAAWCGGGGPAANAAVALRRLGHEVLLACALGDDVLGRIAREELENEGIRLMVPPGAGSTSLAQIQAEGPARRVIYKRGSVAPLMVDAAGAQRWLDGVELLYVDGHEPDAASVLVTQVRERGIPMIADLGSLRPGVEEWLGVLAWAVASPRCAAALARSEDLQVQLAALAQRCPRAVGVGVTAGSRGGVARCGGEDLRWHARKVGVVDSTGAGDAFHAGLADAYLQGMDPAASLEWAATLGASVCRGPGGRKFLPVDRHDLSRFAARWPHRPEPAAL